MKHPMRSGPKKTNGLLFFSRKRDRDSGSRKKLKIECLNDSLDTNYWTLREATVSKKALKAEVKEIESSLGPMPEGVVYLIDFEGDVAASQVETLRELVTSVLMVATEKDKVVVRLDSSGGYAHTYGLAAAQLKRIRDAKIPLVICVDKVAASGGYMMACVANEIVATPTAIIGSIGVVAELPNFSGLLKKFDIQYHQFTAGKYKRTVGTFTENTPDKIEKFNEDLQVVYESFKEHIRENRPSLDIDRVATGECWMGKHAKDLGLVDTLMTSDEYIFNLTQEVNVYRLYFSESRGFMSSFMNSLAQTIVTNVTKIIMESKFLR